MTSTVNTTRWYSIEARLDLSGMPNNDNDNTFSVTLEEGRRCTIFGIGTVLTAIYGESGSITVNNNSMDVSNVVQSLISGDKLDIIVNNTTMGGDPYINSNTPFLLGTKILYMTYTLTKPPVVKIVHYYFSVDSSTNKITGFFNYDYVGANCYVSRIPAPFNDNSTDVFTINGQGTIYVNFTDTKLQQLLGNNTPYFNIYGLDITGNGVEYFDVDVEWNPVHF